MLEDHQKAKALLTAFDDLPAPQRGDGFCELVQMLVGHEVAEEEVLYPVVRKYVDGGDELADERISEQSQAEQELAGMEKADPQSVQFMERFVALRDAVLEHADAEEQSVFPLLATSVEPSELEALGTRYQKAKDAAPTHPHPHAPDTPPGNLVLGPVAALVDRVRDAVR
ncbi:MAG TPA: hemerythrin domain-containing protein, partial [Acidimicrobiales bacterium]|nr:hemerythrin domain-containing protein [Acidimicrobiales bacterium]